MKMGESPTEEGLFMLKFCFLISLKGRYYATGGVWMQPKWKEIKKKMT